MINPITGKIVILHHLTQVKWSLMQKEKKVVALHGFGTSASVVRFSSVSDLLSVDYFMKVNILNEIDFKQVGTLAGFKKLSSSPMTKTFRNFALLPPHIAEIFFLLPVMVLSN